MMRFSSFGAIAAATAILLAPMAPAMARPGWGDGWGGDRHHRHHDRGGDGFGNFLLGAIVAGGLIAVVSSASKSKRDRDNRNSGYSPYFSAEENAAADICVDAAERQLGRNGDDTRVSGIDRVLRVGEGWRVDGRLRGDDRDEGRDEGRGFSCGIRGGELSYLQFADRVAYR